MKTLALVTARGGSKGFPGKNLARLGGVPLVGRSHTLLAAFRSWKPEAVKIFLSTDSAEIAAAWPDVDAPGRLRPEELASDTATSMDVVNYELSQADLEGFKAEALLLLQPTSPLLAVEDLQAAWALVEQGAQCVVGMVPLDHPVQWTWSRDLHGLLAPLLDASEATRRQDLPQGFRPVGFYLATRAFLEKHQSFFVTGMTRSVIVPAERGIDIDHPVDLWMAEGILQMAAASHSSSIQEPTLG